MSAPIANWPAARRGYGFMVRTYYTRHHLGLDLLVPIGTWVLSPGPGGCWKTPGPESGVCITYKPDKVDVLIRFMHLSRYGHLGRVEAGTIMAYSGASGLASPPGRPPTPQLHIDISKHELQLNNLANFLDPETFDWGNLG